MNPMENSSDLSMNMPNASMMFTTYTPTFGNMMFQIMPSQTGEVNNTFGQIPYFSLEALVYMQQMNAQTSPTNIVSGQNTGQQNVTGSYTVTDGAGNIRVQMGSGNF